MKINVLYFSPTGGTKRTAQHLAGALGGETLCTDLTVHPAQSAPADAAVIAVPSFGGRVPPLAAQRIRQLKGGGAPAVLLCVYGNRAYEDCLVELQDLASEAGFRVVAAVAAIAEHSIARQYAAGRPDAQDLARLSAFGEAIREKLACGELTEPELPGNRPYKSFGVLPMLPAPHRRLCFLRRVREGVPGAGHRPTGREQGEQGYLHLLHALHRGVSPLRPAATTGNAGCFEQQAGQGLRGPQRERAVSVTRALSSPASPCADAGKQAIFFVTKAAGFRIEKAKSIEKVDDPWNRSNWSGS